MIVAARRRASREVAVALLAILLVAACATVPHRRRPSAAPPPPPPSAATTFERQVFDLVNRHRASHGLRPLVLDPRITREARRHSAAMADGSVPPGHGGFDDRFASLRRTIGCRQLAENVAMNEDPWYPASEAFQDWLDSPRHRTNIEGRYHSTGIGVATNDSGQVYFTQLFAR